MAIPDFQSMMKPILEIMGDDLPHKSSSIEKTLSDMYGLTEEERKHLLPSGKQRTMDNRVRWAISDIRLAGLIERAEEVGRGFYRITPAGKQILKNPPEKINRRFLQSLSSTEEKLISDEHINENDDEKTPSELIENAKRISDEQLIQELLSRLKQLQPEEFETVVIRLMEKMNYGVGRLTQKSHDGGIDGIIDQDELGLEKIYLQAKRYSDNKVNVKEMRDFIGALTINSARKGVFITTSFFDSKAQNVVDAVADKTVRLISGKELAQLMIKHNVGVQEEQVVTIKKIDEDFFSEFS